VIHFNNLTTNFSKANGKWNNYFFHFSSTLWETFVTAFFHAINAIPTNTNTAENVQFPTMHYSGNIICFSLSNELVVKAKIYEVDEKIIEKMSRLQKCLQYTECHVKTVMPFILIQQKHFILSSNASCADSNLIFF
jgi:hypothetical protein